MALEMKVAAALLTLVILPVAHADSLRGQIEKADKAIYTAMLAKDFATLDKVFKAGCAKGFKYLEAGQTQSLEEMLKNMKMGLGSMTKITQAKSQILTLKEKGKTATGTSKRWVGGIVVGPDKKPHEIVYGGTTEDSYVLEGGKWKYSKLEWKTNFATSDGKPIGAPEAAAPAKKKG